MPLTVTHTFANGTTIDATQINENFDNVEAKFNAAIGVTDLRAKYYRFCISAGVVNTDNAQLPDNVTVEWFRTQIPPNAVLVLHAGYAYVRAIGSGVAFLRVWRDRGGVLTMLSQSAVGAAGMYTMSFSSADLVAGDQVYFRIEENVAPNNWTAVREVCITLWCKEILQESV